MTPAPSPPDEADRLEALRLYDLPGSLPEGALDDLTALAAQICGAPISLITLIDEDRQHFRSRFGLSTSGTPRDISFCAHAILQPDLFIVPDSVEDERFADNPLVTGEPHIRFYAGMRLVTPAGQALGTLCIIDHVPRQLNASQRDALRTLSRQVMSQLELRRQTRELAASERMLRGIIENEPECVKLISADGTLRMMNPAGVKMMEADSFQEIANRCVFPTVIEEHRAAFRELTARIFRGESDTLEFQIDGIKGGRLWLETHATPLRGDADEVVSLLGITRDITARKLAEASLRESQQRTDTLFNASPAAICVNTVDTGRVIDANEQFARFLGFSRDELVGRTVFDVNLWVDGEARQRMMARLKAERSLRDVEAQFRRKNGEVRDVLVSCELVQLAGESDPVTISMFLDVTDRRKAGEALRASEERYRTLFEYAPDGILIADPAGFWLDANASMCAMLGYAREELIGLHASHTTAPAEIPAIEPAIHSIQAGSDHHQEWQLRRKDGSLFPAEIIATKTPDGNMLAMVRDVTERKRIEARFRRLVDSNAQGVHFWTGEGGITGANDAFLRIIGYTAAELETGELNWIAITPPEYTEIDRRSVEELAAKGICAPFEKEYFRKDGTRVPVLIGAATFEDSVDEGVCFVVDLTERKKLEEQFFRAQRMESIGTLAGGIAHDLNNSLGPILLSIDLLKMKFTDSGSQELIDTIRTSAQHGADMVSQVLSFARGIEGRKMEVQLRHVVAEIEKIVNETFLKHVQIRTSIPNGLWPVLGDPTQIHQVLLNLSVNARDAMPRGGTLTISAENVTLDAHYAAMNPDAKPGPHVLIQIEDSGAGIPPAVIEKIFVPFFTTKKIGEGTGLGLSTSLAIVKSHGGFIRVYSEPDKGTKFHIHLPAKTNGASAVIPEPAAAKPRGNGELILVVDDEPSVRQITRHTLEAYGYQVILARDGAEAVACYAARRAEIAVVLTDITMPVMDGPASIQVLRKMNPAVRIIGTSGLSANGPIAQAADLHVKHFLPKPYTSETLLTALKEILTAE